MGMNGEENAIGVNLQQRLAGLIATHAAVPHGNHYWRCSYPCRWQYGTQADHAEHVAEVLQAQFDMFPKGELHIETQYVEGEWGFGAHDTWRWVSNMQEGVPDEQLQANYYVNCLSKRPS